MSRALTVGYCLWIIAAILQLLATILPYWKTNDPSGAVIEWREVNIGLWHKCTGYSTGIFSCDDYDSIWLGQQSEITTARVTMCIAQLINLIILVFFQMGAPWTNCLDEHLQIKIMVWSGALMILSNSLVAIGSGYYGSKVLNDYATLTGLYNRDFGRAQSGLEIDLNGQTMIFGGALYSSWISVIFGMAGGISVLCGACRAVDEDEFEEDTYYHPNQTGITQPSRQHTLPNGYVNKGYEMRMQPQPYV